MKMPALNSFASILAQAPAVSAACGRWPGFALVMTALLGAVALGVLATLILVRAIADESRPRFCTYVGGQRHTSYRYDREILVGALRSKSSRAPSGPDLLFLLR